MSDGNEKLYDFKKRSDEAGFYSDQPSLTTQADAVDADINVIVRRYGITGQLPNNIRIPTYGDFTGIGDFRSALQAIDDAEANFMLLPAELRAKFSNDPQLFLDYCTDPNNLDSLVDLGLAVRNNVPNPADTQPVVEGTTDGKADGT